MRGPENTYMMENYLRWSEKTENYLRWSEKTENHFRWSEYTEIREEWSEGEDIGIHCITTSEVVSQQMVKDK